MKRTESSIYNLRVFHNWIKRKLLVEAKADLLNDGVNDFSILELGVGKGGDLHKWWEIKPKEVIGFDIDERSFAGPEGARQRYKRRSRKGGGPRCSFHVLDIADPKSYDKMKTILGDKKFHIISCQFALHFFFKDDEGLDAFAKIVKSFIAKNGYFIATTMDNDALNEIFKDKTILSNNLFEITVSNPFKNEPQTGKQYVVSFKKKGGNHFFSTNSSTEYVPEIELLTKSFVKDNIKLLEKRSFEEWYKDYNGKEMSKEGEQLSFINTSIVYKKVA